MCLAAASRMLIQVCDREFKMSDDMYAQDSIELLKQSGIDFVQNEKRGIDVQDFGELLMTSGVVLNNEVGPLQRSAAAFPSAIACEGSSFCWFLHRPTLCCCRCNG